MPTGILTADGSIDAVTPREECMISVNGDFGGGTVVVEKNFGDGWRPVYNDGTAYTFTANGDEIFTFAGGPKIRLTLSGSTSPGLNWAIIWS